MGVTRAAPVNIAAGTEDLAVHVHFALEDEEAVIMIVLVAWLDVARREPDKSFGSLGDLVMPLANSFNLDALGQAQHLHAVLPLKLVSVHCEKTADIFHGISSTG
jgi:hypothetical protein